VPARGYAAWIALLIGVYYTFPSLRVETWGLISLSGIGAIAAGTVIYRPARKLPWILLAAALSCFAAGELSYLIAAKIGVLLPYPSFADAFYLACYPLYALGLARFVAARTPHGDRRALIDALTLTAGAALLSWTWLIQPYVHLPGLSGLQRGVAVAYPLGDILMLALLARLLAAGTIRARSVQLLTTGAAAVLCSDAAEGVFQLHGGFHTGTVVDLGWALFYSAWGAAALQPDMTRLTEPIPGQPATVSPWRLALLMLASLIAPVLMLTGRAGGPGTDVSVVAVFSAVLFLLVLARLWDAAASNRRALNRERILRQAGFALVSAPGVPEVAATVTQTVEELLDGRAQGDALLGMRDGGTLRPVARPGPGQSEALSALAASWVPLATGAGPSLTAVRDLSAPARAARPAAAWMLLCPLVTDVEADGPIGLIAVFGERRALADLSATLEILAHQVALTLNSVMLRQQVIRQRNEAYFRALVQDASDAIVITRDDGTVTYATPSTATIFGAAPTTGSRIWELAAAEDQDVIARGFFRLQLRTVIDQRIRQLRIARHDGRVIHVEARCSDLRPDPNVAGLVFTLRDVTGQRELQQQLEHRAFHDALTGLPNRVMLKDRIGQQLAAAARTGAVCGVLFVDLDDFKVINDTRGHSAGDELLINVASRLSRLIRETDTAARLGGDEFAVLVSGAQDDRAIEAAAARVVAAFDAPFRFSDGQVKVSVTVGVSTSDDSRDTDELLRHADLALYAAKAAGKRRWRRYHHVLSDSLHRRRELTEAMEETAARGGFALHYQPIVSLSSGALVGFEALLRWPHPEWGMLQPGQFIALAEETGQIIPIGAWALRTAAADLSRWRQLSGSPTRPSPDGLYVSVNVSARQFADSGFAAAVRGVLEETGLEPAALMLEITETALIPADGEMRVTLAALHDEGIRLAIDDFGTGYSSLAYLQELPVDVIKIDKSFVDAITDDKRQLVLVEGIISIAAGLGLQVIAEGIETKPQRDLLTARGCQYGQGYLLAMPMSPEQAEQAARTGLAAPAGS
jgi:diguanylate cyclase (GGDEF)-like protein/PAS domain S-box-containing protein